MAAYGRPTLRDLFDEAPTPHIAHPPRTHHRDFYLATDGSYRESGGAAPGDDAREFTGGLGVVIETRDGERVARLSVPNRAPDNNVAEYRALHLGLDVLAARSPADASVGVLIDHDALAENLNAAVLTDRSPGFEPTHSVSHPPAIGLHWRGIRSRLRDFAEIRAARIGSGYNPAHPLANAPDEYAHVNSEPDRCVLPESPSTGDDRYPPPSRADRGSASD
ncbi:ribonuclease H [Halosimplex amylolyticum]|uniref:ribonuclease H n=1 Tax=Halosimplex amylolyticum TaxID=3396616 RepID=UPI003F55F365